MKTAIVTDSNSGVTQIEAQKMNVFVLPMPVIIEGQAYYEGIDLLPDQFFRALGDRPASGPVFPRIDGASGGLHLPAVSRRCDGPLG